MPSPPGSSVFPHLSRHTRARLAKLGIDPDLSLASWLGRITGLSPERVTELIAAALNDPLPPAQRTPAVAHLTPGQRLILRLAAQGLTNHEIGAALHISPETVKSQLRRVFVKLGTRSRVTAVLIAIASEQV